MSPEIEMAQDQTPNVTRKKPGYWQNTDNVRQELEQAMAAFGHFPLQRELKEMGLSALSSAITRTGGTHHWREQLGQDTRERIVWSLRTNTDEQNMQLGIANVRALFLERFPLFQERFHFAQDGTIETAQRAEAEEFIRSNLIKAEDFSHSIGGSPRQRKVAPYFEGSHAVALQKTFEGWGLSISRDIIGSKVTRNRRGVVWSYPNSSEDENMRLAIANVQGLFLESFPEFEEIFQRNEDGKISEDDLTRAKEYISERIGTQENFVRVIGASCLRTPHFKRSHYAALEIVFREWGLQFDNRVNGGKDAYEYVDADGETWVVSGYIKRYGMSDNPNSSYFKDIPAIRVIGRKGKMVSAFKKSSLLEKVEAILKRPQIDKETKTYIDDEGNIWCTVERLAKRSGLSHQTVSRRVEGIRFLEGRDITNHPVILYSETEFRQRVQDFLGVPQVDTKTGLYKDENGEVWATRRYLMEKYDIGNYDFFAALSRRIEGRSKDGQERILFSERELIEYFAPSEVDLSISPKQANEQLAKLLESGGGK